MPHSDALLMIPAPARTTDHVNHCAAAIAALSILALSGCGGDPELGREAGPNQDPTDPSSSVWSHNGLPTAASEANGPGMTILETNRPNSGEAETADIATIPVVDPVAAGPSVAWPPLPDPIGLGQRLTTRAWIQDRIGGLPADATDEQIVSAYADATGLGPARQPAVQEPLLDGMPHTLSEREHVDAIVTSDSASGKAMPATPSQVMSPDAPHATSATIERVASVAAPLIPAIGNRKEWAGNYGIAPVATRGNLSVTIYTMRDDPDNYYLMVEAMPGAAAANLIIGNGYFGTITPAMSGSLQKVACQSGTVVQSPDISLSGL